ncbi:hypothetical protein RF11_01682 [Thelohanellus kitauei]|uniref:Uncharacterized protein n=1 Tax=Thelohanellus kitauei TaxID=669202 RepID=A0A0C2M4C7_THEKT|nr:hypothetical protein RF11_01682 [Thelohanellus kitauei]
MQRINLSLVLNINGLLNEMHAILQLTVHLEYSKIKLYHLTDYYKQNIKNAISENFGQLLKKIINEYNLKIHDKKNEPAKVYIQKVQTLQKVANGVIMEFTKSCLIHSS